MYWAKSEARTAARWPISSGVCSLRIGTISSQYQGDAAADTTAPTRDNGDFVGNVHDSPSH
jgi:hypothetical protein